ncbi:MAG: penicillin-binding protein activator [bacterium]|nr:penicillin-binding protein activator [bacterium]
MKKMFPNFRIIVFGFVLSILVVNANGLGQTIRVKGVNYIPEIEVLFNNGVNAFQKGEYTKAKEIFENMVLKYPPHQRITISHIMLAQSLFRLGNFQHALSIVNELIQKYPMSRYIQDANYIKGFCYYRQGLFYEAAIAFLSVPDNTDREKLREKSQIFALKIIENNLNLKDTEKLNEKVTGRIASAIVTIKLAMRYLNIGKKELAVVLLQNFIKRYPDSPYNASIRDMLTKTTITAKTAVAKIGVILPLSGEYANQAKGVLAGIRYVQKKFNNNSTLQIDLVIKDSEGDIVNAVQAARELSNDSQVVAIIGELEREKAIAISAGLCNANVSLLAPTTSGNGVTSLSEYTFQMNSDLETRGQSIAEYAIEQLGLKSFAVLAPTDDYGTKISDSFTSKVEELGGTVVTQKWYYPGTDDLTRQFKAIREIGFNSMNKDSLIQHYTRGLTDLQRRRFDLETIPVTSIDGVFVPCYTEEIKFIAPQFAYVNIKTQLLGDEYWYESEELRKNQQYVEGVIFSSGYYINEIDPDFVRFRNDFRREMQRTPELMELYGADTMAALANAIEQGNSTREEIADHLRNLSNFKGINGLISLNCANRVNAEVRLLTYRNGVFHKLN